MKKSSFFLLILLTTFALMLVGFYNGYPLMEGDSGAYIANAFEPALLRDRLPFYGTFIRVTSLWTSVWFTLFWQCFILAWVLLKFCQVFFGKTMSFRQGLFAIICISAFTCLPFVSAYIMPDIFSAILIVTVMLFLISENDKKYIQYLYGLIIFIAVLIHNSHFLILAIFSFIGFFIALLKKYKAVTRKCIVMISMSVSVWIVVCSMHYFSGYGFIFSRGSHVFMVTRLAESGVLSTYLEDSCKSKNLKICAYQDNIPTFSWDFLWGAESPFYKTGGWDSNKVEYNIIIHDVFTTPKYIKMFAIKCVSATCKELTQIYIGPVMPNSGKGSGDYKAVQTNFSDESRELDGSKQSNRGLNVDFFNELDFIVFLFSVLWILFYFPQLQNKKELPFIFGYLFMFLVVNAFVTTTFSTILSRYQFRVFWLWSATNLLIIINHYWRKYIPIEA